MILWRLSIITGLNCEYPTAIGSTEHLIFNETSKAIPIIFSKDLGLELNHHFFLSLERINWDFSAEYGWALCSFCIVQSHLHFNLHSASEALHTIYSTNESSTTEHSVLKSHCQHLRVVWKLKSPCLLASLGYNSEITSHQSDLFLFSVWFSSLERLWLKIACLCFCHLSRTRMWVGVGACRIYLGIHWDFILT